MGMHLIQVTLLAVLNLRQPTGYSLQGMVSGLEHH